MDYRILGPIAILDGDREVALSGQKLKMLLALLVVRAGETVTADRLADDLWGDAVPAGVQNSLQSLISKLRRALGTAGSDLTTDGRGYRLRIDPSQVDATRFAMMAADGHAALVDGRSRVASDLLGEALALWRGRALDGLADEGILQREATRLDELRWSALEDRFDADLRLGRHAELIAELGAVVQAHPLRERMHGFLMLALYRAGRQAEALRAFQTARSVLGDELGLDPGPELRALETSILNHDPALDLEVTERVPARGRRTNLTASLSSFVGRERDLEVLHALVGRSRLVTVVGPGGAGKTRLVLETAARLDGGEDVWLVELASLRSGAAVAEMIASTVGVAEGVLTTTPASAAQSLTERISDHLSGRKVVIVLDNCEHVIAEAARVAEQLLMGCPELRILATSREALGVPGETIWPAPPMSTGDAVDLFVARAGASSGFELTSEMVDTVTKLCERLDGLPLAIELAAGRVRAIPVKQLAERLDDRFRILTGGARTALPRQQTLRAVVEWSYDLLFQDEQRVFERLSVFAGGCTLAAAESVCAGDDIVVDDVPTLLAHLVDKSLVVADHSAVAHGGEVRFRLLQTLALFGRERLAAVSGSAEAARERHATYFEDLCNRGRESIRGVRQEPWLTEVETEVDNLHVALTWVIEQADARRVQWMLGGLGWSWWFAGSGDDGWRWLVAGLTCAGPTTPAARASAAMWAGYVGACAGAGMDAAAAYGEEAVELSRGIDGDSELDQAIFLLAGIRRMQGRQAEAIELFDEANALYSRGEGNWDKAMAAGSAARSAEVRGDTATGYQLQCDSMVHFEADGVDWASAVINGDIAILAMRLGRFDVAFERLQKARDAARFLRLGGYEALQLSYLAVFALAAGDAGRADELADEAIALAEEVRYRTAEAFARLSRAVVRRTQGRLDEAVEDAGAALSLFRAVGLPNGEPQALTTVGFIATARGDLAAARTVHLEALELARLSGNRRGIALALEGLAGVASTEGSDESAALLLGAALAQRAADGGAPAGLESDAAAITDVTTARLGAAAVQTLIDTGRDTPIDDLVGANATVAL